MIEEDDDLARIADAILVGETIDWEGELRRRPDLTASFERLRRIEAVVRSQSGSETAPFPPEGTTAHPAHPAPVAPATAPSPVAPHSASDLPFRYWGDLELRARLATGGYSEVFRAWDPGVEREVALKLIRTDRPIAAVDRERYLIEARRLARVRHPNVLVVYGADVHQERLGLWTELIEGETYEQLLKTRGPLAPSEGARVAVHVCRALAAVHAAGLVHRDVKAGNVMRERQGRTVLLDFGAGAESAPDPSGKASLPEGGTPLIMAPELLRGETATPRSDLYAVGALLYRLLTGRYPIETRSPAELLARASRGDWTPVRDLRPDASGVCVRVVEKALDPDPARRHASAGAMERDLQAIRTEQLVIEDDRTDSAFEADSGTDAFRIGPWRVPARALIAGAALLAVLALLSEFVSRRDVARPSASALRSAVGGSAGRAADLVRVTWIRERAGEGVFLLDGDVVTPEDALMVEAYASDSTYAYVVERDPAGGGFLWFPNPDLDRGNPIRPGEHARLPGSRGGRPYAFRLAGRAGTKELVLYGSRRPIEAFETTRPEGLEAPERPLDPRSLAAVDAALQSVGVQGSAADEAIARHAIRLKVRAGSPP